jgi:hypothetical protein
MPRNPPPTTPGSTPTPSEQVQTLEMYLNRLRKRQYPILSQWKKHNLTQADNSYGFGLLDLLKDGLDQLEARLTNGPPK